MKDEGGGRSGVWSPESGARDPGPRPPDPGRFLRFILHPSSFILLLTFGCSEEFDRVETPTRSITGQVTFQGEPVTTGWIEFTPTDGTAGNVVTGRLRDDGRYAIARIALGRFHVEVVRTHPPLPAAYSTDESTLATTIRADGDGVLDFHLP